MGMCASLFAVWAYPRRRGGVGFRQAESVVARGHRAALHHRTLRRTLRRKSRPNGLSLPAETTRKVGGRRRRDTLQVPADQHPIGDEREGGHPPREGGKGDEGVE